MKTLIETSLAGALLLALTACGSSGSGSAPDSDMEANAAAGGVEAIFRANRDGDPATVADADAFGAEIDLLFGNANAEPVGLVDGDGIVDILNRARNV